ncbi:unnamed protein product [Fraxinus pennsylvanica]|uniref:Wall-associated receptor kinase galacturonan-binding domain-containing protein n=1 Tax=Fraxinus pennsylvanica TaxID=56036 RepID=A0AAD1ZES1_9LAMI|nr:unnamed protein product [Fraxinus pennsylvanica]
MRNIRLLFAVSIVFLILLHCASYCEAEKNHECPPTSCGSITNISYPFRLRGDLENCGDSSYELACENNRTILYLNSSRFFVQSISYNNYSIRVLDPGLEKTSCASFPINNLMSLESDVFYPYFFLINTPIIYIHCEAPAKSPFYVDTCICSKNISPQKYSYLVVGNEVRFADLEDSCSIDTMAWISKEFPIVYDASCSDIQDGLASGFVLLWYRVYCSECYAKNEMCLNKDDNTIECHAKNEDCLKKDDNTFECFPSCGISDLSHRCLLRTWAGLRYFWTEHHRLLEQILGSILAARFFCGILFMMKPDDRPSMTKVIEMLEGDVELLLLPPKPFLSPEEMPDSDIDMNDMEFCSKEMLSCYNCLQSHSSLQKKCRTLI